MNNLERKTKPENMFSNKYLITYKLINFNYTPDGY